MSNQRGTESRNWPAIVAFVAGMVLLFASAGFWAVTGHQSALYVQASLFLIGGGAIQGLRGAKITISREEPTKDDER